MVTAAFTRPVQDSGWMKYIVLSVIANLLLIYALNIGNPPQKFTEIPSLRVNLMALSAPEPEPLQPEVIETPVPSAIKKIETQKQAVKRVVVAKTQSKSVSVPAKEVPLLQKPERQEIITKKAIEKPVTSKPRHDTGKKESTVIHEANYRRQTPPVYPRRALELGQEGVVILHAEVNQNGLPGTLKVAQSSGHRLLDMAAVSAVKKWEFEPTTIKGNTITGWVRVPVRFVIQ
jgi:protein TonB